MAAVCAMGSATGSLQKEVVVLKREVSFKNFSSASAPDSVAVGASAGKSMPIRAQQVQNRPPVRPAVSFPLFPRNMEAYSGVSGQTTTPLVPFLAKELKIEEVQKGKVVPIPALNIVMRSDLGVVMERRW